MNPVLSYSSKKSNNNNYTFQVKRFNVSLINAIRRVILSNIETVVFKTFPHDK